VIRSATHRVRRLGLDYVLPLARSLREETYPYHSTNFWNHCWYNTETDAAHSIERADPDRLSSQIHYRGVEASLLTACARHDIEPSGTVLDVGSGMGHWIEHWSEWAEEVVGIDISNHAVESLEERYSDREDIGIERADVAEAIPLEDGSVDLVSAVGVMFHLVHEPRFDAALAELARVLDEDGTALLTGQAGLLSYDRQHQERADSQHVEVFKRLRSRREWARRCREAGLELVGVVESPSWADVHTPESNVLVVLPA